MKFGVVVFPGSNCDQDCAHVLKEVLRQPVAMLWHQDPSLSGCDAIVLPGGFSYGDYLRTGAIARFSPIMRAVTQFAKDGGLLIGICNGFQILVESGLLPGALMRNPGLKFICRYVNLRVDQTNTPFTNRFRPGQVVRMPIAHNEGRYVAPSDRDDLGPQQIVLRYCDEDGHLVDSANPNGSTDWIAGIVNREGNVLGMMPHPERASEEALSSSDGRLIFESMIESHAHA